MSMTSQQMVAVVGTSTDRRKFGNKGVRAFVAVGLKVTSRAFGTGRRMPIAQRFME